MSAGLGLLALAAPGPASAATQLGETFVNSGFCDPFFTELQTTSPGNPYAAPTRGVITSWSYQADATPPQVEFKVGRSVGANDFLIVAESGLETIAPNELHTAQIRVPVNQGDVIGLYQTNADCGRGQAGYGAAYQSGDKTAGATYTFIPATNFQLDVAAVLEPDADNDGFGDETQDQCPTDPTKQGDCAPPETTITKQPKDKTKKKQAEFEFTSSEPGSSFECSLDGAGFAPCISPRIEKVGKGKHIFQVRAIDPSGNVDPTPAIDDWKVKKKKKKKKK